MTSSYEVAREALRLWRSNYGNTTLDQECIRYDGYYWQWAYQGNESIQSYDPATAAADASPMYTDNVNDPGALPGDLWYWWWGRDGHVGTVLGHDSDGRVLVTHTSSSGDLVEQWTNNVRISHADTIPHRFRGGSHHYGSNSQRTGLSAWPNPENEDDMYSDDDRKRDNTTAKQVGEIHWMLDKRIRPQLTKIEGILNGEGWGVRHLLGERRDEIAALTEMVEHLAPGKIEDDHSSKLVG